MKNIKIFARYFFSARSARAVCVSGLALAVCCFTETLGAVDPPVEIFSGGSFDGWDADFTQTPGVLPGPHVILSWGMDHFFDARANSCQAPDLTIRESTAPDLGIKQGNIMRIAFPALARLRWNIDDMVYSGSAAGKVGAAVLAEDATVIEVPVVADFAAEEELVLVNLSLTGLINARQIRGRLRLDYNGDGVWNTSDEYTMTVGMIWPGGSFDGWDMDDSLNTATIYDKGAVIIFR